MWMQGARVRVSEETGPDRWVGLTGTVDRVYPAGEVGYSFERTRVQMDDGGFVSFEEHELVNE